jgi:hypothetical protein
MDDRGRFEQAREVLRWERILKNEELAREFNEHFARSGGESVVLQCECGRPTCLDLLHVPRRLLEASRAAPNRFVIATGHEIPDVEAVLETEGACSLVEKLAPPEPVA